MSRRDDWRKVLDQEMQRWSALSCEQLQVELREGLEYVVEMDSKKYQVEVEILENTATYLHVTVAVDDGTLPASIRPETDGFIRCKP